MCISEAPLLIPHPQPNPQEPRLSGFRWDLRFKGRRAALRRRLVSCVRGWRAATGRSPLSIGSAGGVGARRGWIVEVFGASRGRTRTSIVVLGTVRVRREIRVPLVLPLHTVFPLSFPANSRDCDSASRNNSKQAAERLGDSGSAGIQDNALVQS